MNPQDAAARADAILSAPEAAARAGQYLTIIEDGDTFPFTWAGFLHTHFTLRLVPDSLHKVIRRKHTTTKWERNQRVELVDWTAVAEDCLAHAVVRIDGLRRRVQRTTGAPAVGDGTEAIQWDSLDPARRGTYLALLPETLKAEIMRICVGKEAGELDPNASPTS